MKARDSRTDGLPQSSFPKGRKPNPEWTWRGYPRRGSEVETRPFGSVYAKAAGQEMSFLRFLPALGVQDSARLWVFYQKLLIRFQVRRACFRRKKLVRRTALSLPSATTLASER